MLDKILMLICGFIAGLGINLSKTLYTIAYENSLNYIKSNYIKKESVCNKEVKNESK